MKYIPKYKKHFQSVFGLNFDFLLLNTIGFGSYTLYNLLFYFDTHIQVLEKFLQYYLFTFTYLKNAVWGYK